MHIELLDVETVPAPLKRRADRLHVLPAEHPPKAPTNGQLGPGLYRVAQQGQPYSVRMPAGGNGRRAAADLLTRDKGRGIAANVAKPPELLKGPRY